jgi:prefoldin subunit 5
MCRVKEDPSIGNRPRTTDLIDQATNPLVVGKQILVPLTSSLYVPGKMSDVESVIVDVGTGYYVKKVGPRSYDILTLTPVVDEERGD